MIIEPNCDLPEEIYKDWLADQGFDQLREIPIYSFIGGIYSPYEMAVHWGFNVTLSSGSNEFIIGSPLEDCDDITHDEYYCLGSNCGSESQAPDLLINEIAQMRTKYGDGWISRWT